MSKSIYWAPVGTQTGKPWPNCVFRDKNLLKVHPDRCVSEWKTHLKIKQVQIVVLPQKKRKK